MAVAGYLSAVFMGLILGLFGGGGAILTVPIFVYLFHLKATAATGHALLVVGLCALVGALRYAQRQEINVKLGVVFALPSAVGVYLSRTYIVTALPEEIYRWNTWSLSKDTFILIFFALMMLTAAAFMIRGRKKISETTMQKMNFSLVATGGLVIGLITGFVGAGGGFMIVPALLFFASMDLKVAVGTSLSIIAVKSLIGFIGEYQSRPDMNWMLLISFSALAFIGIVLGTQFSKKIPSARLKPIFGYFVLIMAVFMLAQSL